ncbi:MAG: phosphatase PAP2 family protein [Firmicutes bacterium]|nr:phosphatase PAP2 family protein [Bacillota bacterium]
MNTRGNTIERKGHLRLAQWDEVLSRLARIFIFWIIYIVLFLTAEQRDEEVEIIFVPIDDLIPFCEYFIVPYFMWFGMIALVVGYFAFFAQKDKEYNQLMINLCLGMVVFLAVCYIYPNGLNLRPHLTGENIFEKMVMFLYKIDTPTNVLPSLHVYNTVCCLIAVLKNKFLRSKKAVVYGIWILSILIILATMFLKQHSVIDVITALGLNWAIYNFVYREK